MKTILLNQNNRFRNWQPNVRNLDSTYEVKDINFTSSVPSQYDNIVDPSRRIGMGGKKLFMSKENGIEKANNFQSGYIPPNYR